MGGELLIEGYEGQPIATVRMAEWECPESKETYDDEKQTEINAVMLANAPEMKALLIEALEVVSNYDETTDAWTSKVRKFLG